MDKVEDYSFDEAYEMSHLEDNTLATVELEALVVMKIIKHCHENLPQLVTGQLLGLDIKNTLQVTDCVPFPKIGDDNEDENEDENADEADAAKGAEYQIEMMKALKEVNVDNNIVGWYSSTYMDSFLNKFTIGTQYKYQERIRKCVVIIYDPLKTSQGILALRALRLTQAFMNLYKSQSFTKDSITKANLSFTEVFEEVPLTVHNQSLVEAFLFDSEERVQLSVDFDRLDLGTSPFLEKSLDFLLDCMDELGSEQTKLRYFNNQVQKQQAQQQAWLLKRRAENVARKKNGLELLPEEDSSNSFKASEPSRLDSILLTNQINGYARQMNHFSANAFAKIFLVGGLQKQ